MNEKQVAEFLGVTVSALRRWRFEGRGPGFFRLEGRLVRYRQEDVEGLAVRPERRPGSLERDQLRQES
jgi:predicted site-specific integrase-resolvase